MPTLRLWHHADKPLASQKGRESALGTSTTQEASQWGGLNQTGSRSGKTLWVTTLQKVQSCKGKTGEGLGTPGASPAFRGGPGQAESSLAKEMVQGPHFGPWSRKERLKANWEAMELGDQPPTRQKP